MKKIHVIAASAFLFLATAFLFAQPVVLKVKVQTANVRSEPDLNSSVVKQLTSGTLIEAVGKVGDWYEIMISDASGKSVSAFIHALVVEVVGGEQKVVPQPKPVLEEVGEPAARSERPTAYAKPFGSGGFKILGGLVSANASYRLEAEQGTQKEIDKYKKSKQGFFGGIGLEFGSRLGLEIDILYFQKGVRLKGDDSAEGFSGSFDVTTSLDEISVPALLKFRFLPGSTPYIVGGGEIAYVLSAKSKYTATDATTKKTYAGTTDLKKDSENLNTIDYGLVFGAGFELNSGFLPFYIEGRYHMGLANMFKKDAETPQDVKDTDSVRTTAIVVTAGVKF